MWTKMICPETVQIRPVKDNAVLRMLRFVDEGSVVEVVLNPAKIKELVSLLTNKDASK